MIVVTIPTPITPLTIRFKNGDIVQLNGNVNTVFRGVVSIAIRVYKNYIFVKDDVQMKPTEKN